MHILIQKVQNCTPKAWAQGCQKPPTVSYKDARTMPKAMRCGNNHQMGTCKGE